MDIRLAKLLGAYIGDLYTQIQELPMRLDQKSAAQFDFDKKYPLQVYFGAEFENLLWDKDLMISALLERDGFPLGYRHPKAKSLIARVKSRCNTALYHDSPGGDWDNNKIELRLAPREPLQILRNARKLEDAYNQAAVEDNLKPLFSLTQHWHMSINQKSKNRFSNCVKNLFGIVDNKLSLSVQNGCYMVQKEVPAFFIDPMRVEDSSLKAHYSMHGLGMQHNTVKFDASGHMKADSTVEARFGAGVAEQPVALYLSAIYWGVKTFPLINEYNGRYCMYTRWNMIHSKNENVPDEKVDFPSNPKGAYMALSDRTVQSKKIDEFLPRNIFNALVVNAAQKYKYFLQSQPSKALYNEKERGHLNQRCDEIILYHS